MDDARESKGEREREKERKRGKKINDVRIKVMITDVRKTYVLQT